jgi:hypothetical protein
MSLSIPDPRPHHVRASEMYGPGSFGERGECGGHVFQVEDLAVTVIGCIHPLELRILIDHCLTYLSAVILDSRGADSQPTSFVTHDAYRNMWIRHHLFEHVFDVSGLEIELSLDLGNRADDSHLGCVAIDRGQIVRKICFKVFVDFIHFRSFLEVGLSSLPSFCSKKMKILE